MVAFETLHHTFQHPWREISLASWFKYPNPNRPDVLSVDLLHRDFNPETGVLKTTRLLTMKANIPKWLEVITGGGARAYFLEESEIDAVNKKMTLSGRNLSWSQLIDMKETCVYTESPENSSWTHLEQEGRVRVNAWAFAKRVEDWCVGIFKQNASKGRDIMEQAWTKIQKETTYFQNLIKQDSDSNMANLNLD